MFAPGDRDGDNRKSGWKLPSGRNRGRQSMDGGSSGANNNCIGSGLGSGIVSPSEGETSVAAVSKVIDNRRCKRQPSRCAHSTRSLVTRQDDVRQLVHAGTSIVSVILKLRLLGCSMSRRVWTGRTLRCQRPRKTARSVAERGRTKNKTSPVGSLDRRALEEKMPARHG